MLLSTTTKHDYHPPTRRLDQVLLQDVSVPDLVGLDALDSLGGTGHGQDLVDDRLDVLFGGEVEHLQHLLLATQVRSTKGGTVTGKGEPGDREGLVGESDGGQPSLDLQQAAMRARSA